MKKLSVFILLIVAITTSCSNDDSNEDQNSNVSNTNLIGKWQLTKVVADGIEEPQSECDLKATTEFKEDGKLIEINFRNTNPSNDQSPCPDGLMEEWEWSVEGDQLTYMFPQIPTQPDLIFTITFPNNNTFILEGKNNRIDGSIEVFSETYSRL